MAYVTDQAIYSPVSYLTFLPPQAGGNYSDPAFGTAARRISDARNTPDVAGGGGNLLFIANEYSTVSPFNADNSRLLLLHVSHFALYDGNGNYIRDLPVQIVASSEPRWSRSDPNVFYYHEVYGNQLKSYNVATDESAIVHTFGEYTTISGLGESDISFDGDCFVLAGDNRYIFVYQVSTDTKSPALDTGVPGLVDAALITPNDNVIVKWRQAGTNRYNGIELYDRNMNFLRQLTNANGHADVTRDVDGPEIMIWANAGDPNPVCTNGVVKVRLADASQTCLLSLDWSLALHVSAPDGNGWVIVSTYATSDPDPLVGWRPYTNEILQVTLDGSEIRRLAHHRSRPFSDYWWQPRASVSHDGSKMIYSSNYGLQAILGAPGPYADTYLVDVASVAPAPAGSTDPVATRVEQDSPVVAYTCPPYSTWYANTDALQSGGTATHAMTAGCRATYSFTGTAVSWIGLRDQWAGIANVYIDAELRGTVDTFSASVQPKAVLASIGGLSAGAHTLAIEVLGASNPGSAGSWVWIDAFDVASRVEEDHSAVAYACPSYSSWYTNTDALHSGGNARRAMNLGCQTTFSFTGTAVSWIGLRDQWAGIAQIYVDGAFRAEVDTYAPSTTPLARLYTLSGLSSAPHTFTIVVTGRINPASGGSWVWVDGFETPP